MLKHRKLRAGNGLLYMKEDHSHAGNVPEVSSKIKLEFVQAFFLPVINYMITYRYVVLVYTAWTYNIQYPKRCTLMSLFKYCWLIVSMGIK